MLFNTEAEQALLAREHQFLPRLTYQFHWANAEYQDFDAYLATFRRSARRNVQRERCRAASGGLTLQTLHGEELQDIQWDALYAFYNDTTARKWGQEYLTRAFFEHIRQTFAHRVVVTLASDGARPVAGALSFHKGKHLYGRYWGCLKDVDALHFELCYYRPIELCIDNGWTRFEAGAQGQHKIKRGLLPAETYSCHWLKHSALRNGVTEYLQRERAGLQHEMEILSEHSPFRRDVIAG